MESFLIYGSDPVACRRHLTSILDDNKIDSWDRIYLEPGDKDSIGISQAKKFTDSLKFKPRKSPYIAAVIENAQNLTLEAQNALLKTIEEPPPQVKIYLICPNPDQLIQTIVSRCHPIYITSPKNQPENASAFDGLTDNLIKNGFIAMRDIEKFIKTKEDAAAFVNLAITTISRRINTPKSMPPPHNFSKIDAVRMIRKLILANKHLDANIDYKLTLYTNLYEGSPDLDKSGLVR